MRTKRGNQFYVFDVHPLAVAIDQHGALTLPPGPDDSPEAEPINGVTRQQLARFAGRFGEVAGQRFERCSGEVLALNRVSGASVLREFDRL